MGVFDNNKNKPQPRKISNEEQAYDDLLDSYSSIRNTQKAPTPNPQSTQKHSGFKLDIKDLDGEFNQPPKSTKPKPTGVPPTQIYKKAQPEQRKRPVHNYREEYGKSEKKKVDEAIELLPAFEDDRRYDTKAKNDGVKPVYKNTEGVKRTKQSLEQTRQIKKQKTSAPYKKPEIQTDENGRAVIVKKNNMPVQKKLVLFLKQNKKAWALLAVCILAAVLISTYTISCINDILAIKRDSETVVTVNIPAQTDTKGAIDILKDNKLIKHKYFCTVYAKARKYKNDNYLTGIYYLTESMGLENMLSSFKRPMVTGDTVILTFPEGYCVNQIAEKLEKYEVCTQAAFFATIRDVDFSAEYSFVAQMDEKDKRFQTLEGYLYPDTYEFYIGENPASVIRKFLENFNNKWTDEYAQRASAIGMSMDDVITLASIIEKEAYGADQMPLVSSVFHNRLKKSGIYPTLGSDATKEYVSEYISKNVTNATELGTYQKNYDTYKCAGLPIGAICNPGNDSIHAALYPADTGYYYFLHDNNKKIYLAATDAEHSANGLAALRANSKNSK